MARLAASGGEAGLGWINFKLLELSAGEGGKKGAARVRLWGLGCLPGHMAGLKQLNPGVQAGGGAGGCSMAKWQGATLEGRHLGLGLATDPTY